MLEKIKDIDQLVEQKSDLVLLDLREIFTTLRSLESKVQQLTQNNSSGNANTHTFEAPTPWLNHGHGTGNILEPHYGHQNSHGTQNGHDIQNGHGSQISHETPINRQIQSSETHNDHNLHSNHAPAKSSPLSQSGGASSQFHLPSHNEPPNNTTESSLVPSLTIFTELVDIFHKNVYPGFRVIHPSLRSQLIEEYALLLTNDPTGSEILPHLLGIILVSVPFMKNRILQHQKDSYQAHCRSNILTKCISITLIEHLQAMALLTFDLFGRSNDPLTWSYIALISAAVIHLGLTKEPAESEKCIGSPELVDGPSPKRPKIITPQSITSLRKTVTSFEEECQRNLFWEIFILDRLSSVSNSFPCKIDEAEIERQLPLREDLWRRLMKWVNGRKLNDPEVAAPQFNENHDSAAFLVEIVAKLGKIHTFLRESFDISDVKQVLAWQMKFSELSAEVVLWKNQLPDSYQAFLETRENSFHRELTVKDTLLFSIYHMTIIRLNSSVGYQNFDSDYILFSSMARSKCLESAQSIAEYSTKIPNFFAYTESDPYAICGPYYGFTIWVAARLLFVNAIRSEEDFGAALDQLLLALSRIGLVWRSSAKYKEILDLLKKEESEYRANGQSVFTIDPTLSVNSTDGGSQLSLHPESSRLFSDMRFNAYSLGVILSKKVEQVKRDGISFSPHNQTDFSNFFQWFKIPINELNGVSTNQFTDFFTS